jgi:hypothetical protein
MSVIGVVDYLIKVTLSALVVVGLNFVTDNVALSMREM